MQWIGFSLDARRANLSSSTANDELTTPEGREDRLRADAGSTAADDRRGMQAQSIRQTFGGIYMRLTVILGVSTWAEGHQALQQIQIQQQALLQQATAARPHHAGRQRTA